ncbi:hypothetical protein BDW59DRAFT_69618 [Aspergillus cavernicola]|uniref:BTB domain-containing protein n=1 Tax=Aspergillus cavernicola TaxID=176166 RepID=A0ABR4IDA4_9EURO
MPLYHGPIVKINIENSTYEVSKSLLCKHSSYFAAMFNGKFKESEEQSAELELIDGVVSTRSFELLLQWLYVGRIVLDEKDPGDRISALLEFARLADMLYINTVGSQIVEHIKTTVLNNPAPGYLRTSDTNVHHITSNHIHHAMQLPQGDPVRLLFSKAAIEGYLRSEHFKFQEETREIPEFAADFLEELKIVLKNVKTLDYHATFVDPFSGETLRF